MKHNAYTTVVLVELTVAEIAIILGRLIDGRGAMKAREQRALRTAMKRLTKSALRYVEPVR